MCRCRSSTASTPAGAFEAYQSYAPVAAAAREEYVPVATVLGLGLLALYLSLFPVLRRVTRRLEEHVDEIRHQSLHDSLTGLPNRELFHDRLEQAIALARREAGCAGGAADRPRPVQGDQRHARAPERRRRCSSKSANRSPLAVRESDTVARLGGDEFAIVAPRTDAAGALTLADKLREALARPSNGCGIDLEIDASIGIAIFPEHGADADTLLRRADVALYLSKEAHAPLPVRRRAGSLLPGAARARRRPAPCRRPRTTSSSSSSSRRPICATGDIVRAEALVRWQHPTRGLLHTRRLPAARRAHGAHAPADPHSSWRRRCSSAARGGTRGWMWRLLST